MNDIDRPEDFSLIRDDSRFSELFVGETLISVIIPTLNEAAITSARRWEQRGIIRTTVINQIVIAGFLSGLPAYWLKRLYTR